MSRLKRFSVVALILAAVFAFSGIAQARNVGQIVYVEGITRDANTGEVTATTGNMKVQNIATGVTRTVVTNAATPLVMLNPAFTADGKKILFTAGNVTKKYKVYLVSSQAGTDLATAIPLKEDTAYNLRYATLSPDSDGATTGLLAYTRDTAPTTGTHELWVYNFVTKKSTLLVVPQSNRQLKHPVFLSDNDTIAYVEVKNTIQNIYTVKASSGLITPITTNIGPTPHYGRLVSNVNKIAEGSPGVKTHDVLIYAKQVSGTYNYDRFDIYVCDLDPNLSAGTVREKQVTDTSLKDEYEPAFYGNDTTDPVLADTTGDMFYSADITGTVSVWQTNFDTDSLTQSNGAKFERTNENSGLANWGVSPILVSGEATIGLEQTRIVFNKKSNPSAPGDNEISRADVQADGKTETPIQITIGGTKKANPSLSGNGGTILYDNAGQQEINKMNHDGSVGSTIATLDPLKPEQTTLKQPNISSDGRWAVYVRDGNLEAIFLPKGTVTPLEIKENGNLITDAENPVFNPDMTQIVYSRGTGTNNKIWMVSITINLDDNTITAGTPQQLSGTELSINDRYPSFSPDGRYIIFTSDRWDGHDAIYVMNSGKTGTSGSGVTRIVDQVPAPAVGLSTTNPFAVFGPVNTDSENYYVAYVKTGDEIQIAKLSKAGMSASGGENLVVDFGPTTPGPTPEAPPVITPNPTGLIVSGKFSWARLREKGSVYAERVLQSKAVSGTDIDYYIKVDVDEAAVAKGYIVQEVLPGWTTAAAKITIDGVAANSSYVAFLEDTPAAGQNTLKLIFSESLAAPHLSADHIIKITATTTGTSGDTQNIMGTVEYGTTIGNTEGNNTVLIGNPYCPFDIYNAGGNVRMDTDKGIIENLDLLYAIDCWARNVQLQGYMGLWPLDPLANYDDIILDTIEIWATVPAGGVAGEYCFDVAGLHEMYWKSGVWVE